MSTEDTPLVEHLVEPNLSPAEDARLRELLHVCFTGPEDSVFEYRRWWREMPAYRCVIRAGDGMIVAHAAVHDKTIGTEKGELHIGGVSEVCTHPHFRRQGCAKALLAAAHERMRQLGMVFGMLFGRADVYASSGYVPIVNPIRCWDIRQREWITRPVAEAMVCPLADRPWPDGVIDLRGPIF